MAWPRRPDRQPAEARASPVARAEVFEGAVPGIAALFQGIAEDRTHAVLDLGAASEQSLRVYSRFARWIHFADLLSETWPQQSSGGAWQLPKLERAYDLVFGWDILDRMFPEAGSRLVQWLTNSTAPGARVHVIVRASEDAISRPLRFTLMDVGRIRYEIAGTARLPLARLLPAEVGKVLAPLRVEHAFTLKSGLREYLAVRP
ncbi:MAG TPA: hypothetical protein VFO52_02045 [Longimicrobiales bacterium]|nr:hypothetical protein [Longimicrobiales bacterium]